MPKCNILENHACITVSGYWRPCCRFNEKVIPWQEKMHVNNFTFDQWRNSKIYNQIKLDQKNGWHEGCLRCKIAEDTGNSSTRLIFNKRLSGNKDTVEYIEISLSNECNLACKMCGSWASSTWNDIVNNNKVDLQDFHKPHNHSEIDVEKIFSNMDLSNLKTIKLLGGEPFITPQTNDFFKYLDKIGILEKIELMTSTNATFFPKKLISYLEKVKSISMSLSIDGLQDINNYVRYKSDWQTFDKVVDNWIYFFKDRKDKKALKLSSIINAYNVHQILDLHDYADEKNLIFIFNIINGPDYLKLEALPESYVNYIKDSFKDKENAKPILNYFNMVKLNNELRNKLKIYTEKLDRITGLYLNQCNPKLYNNLFN